MLRRLPISLKFDDEDSDFYCGFIEPKKNDRELTTLILDLLHAYYERDDIRNAVDDYILEQSPYLSIHKEIERIALEHSKNATFTKMTRDVVVNEQNNFNKTSEPTDDADMQEDTKEQQYLQLPEATLKELQDLREEVKGVNALKEEMDKMQKLLGQLVGTQQGVEQKVEQSIVIKDDREKKKPKIEKVSIDIETEEKDKVKDDVQEVQEEKPVKTKKPKSFAKLMGSLE